MTNFPDFFIPIILAISNQSFFMIPPNHNIARRFPDIQIRWILSKSGFDFRKNYKPKLDSNKQSILDFNFDRKSAYSYLSKNVGEIPSEVNFYSSKAFLRKNSYNWIQMGTNFLLPSKVHLLKILTFQEFVNRSPRL